MKSNEDLALKVSLAAVVLIVVAALNWAPGRALVAGACDSWSALESVTVAEPANREHRYKGQYSFSASDWFTDHIPVWKAALADYRDKQGIQYLEVGVFEGRSSIWMIENILTHSSSRATVIDPFVMVSETGDVEQIFRANLHASGGADRTTIIKGYSQVELRKLPLDSYDIIYIDGSHAAPDVLEDIVLAWRLLNDGGLLILDDYEWPEDLAPEQKPRIAIDAFVRCFRGQIEVVHSAYQVFLRKRAAKSLTSATRHTFATGRRPA